MANQGNGDDDSLMVGIGVAAIAVCCLPCLCAAGGFIVVRHVCTKVASYHRPSTLRRMAKEKAAEDKRIEQNTIKRNVPKNVAPRKKHRVDPMSGLKGPKLESHLTIGRPVEVAPAVKLEIFGEDFGENGSLCGTEAVVELPVKTTCRQEQSILFKLPLEIRRQVYTEAIGGYKIHVRFNQTYRKMAHQRCKHTSSNKCYNSYCTILHRQPGMPDKYGQADLLALLKTCRMVYGEAVEILYRENTFSFPKLGEVLRLSMTLLPERMSLIRNVQWKVCCCSPTIHATTPWLDCKAPDYCSCVACMPDQTYSELKIRRWIVYTWMMRSHEANPEAHALDHVSHAGN